MSSFQVQGPQFGKQESGDIGSFTITDGNSSREGVAEDIVGNMLNLQLDDNLVGSRFIGESSGVPFILEELHFNPAGVLPCPMDNGSVFRKIGKGFFNSRTKDRVGQTGTFDLLTDLSQTEALQMAQGSDAGIVFTVDTAPPATLNALVDVYFQEIHPYFPIIHKSVFLLQYRNPNIPSPPPYLLHAVYAAAAIVAINIPIDMFSFYSKAQQLVSTEMDHPRLSLVQACLLLSNFHGLAMRASGFSLTNMNLALTTALELGLHRDPSNWSIPKVEKAMRRRVFWACFTLDRWRAAMTGYAFIFRDDEYTVEPPRVEEYDSIAEGQYAVQLANLSEIMGKILRRQYLPIRTLGNSSLEAMHSRAQAIHDLKRSLNTWQSALPDELHLPTTESRQITLARSFGAHLDLMYHALNILLYRQFLHQDPNEARMQPVSADAALSQCFGSARQILSTALNHLCVQDAQRYAFTFNMYAIFNSVVIWIHLIGLSASMNGVSPTRVKLEEAASPSPPPPPQPLSPRVGLIATLSPSHQLIMESRSYLTRATQMLHEFQFTGSRLMTPMLGTIYCLAGLRHVVIEAPEPEDGGIPPTKIEADDATIAQITYAQAANTFDSTYTPPQWQVAAPPASSVSPIYQSPYMLNVADALSSLNMGNQQAQGSMVNFQGVDIFLPTGMTPEQYLSMSMPRGAGGQDFMPFDSNGTSGS